MQRVPLLAAVCLVTLGSAPRTADRPPPRTVPDSTDPAVARANDNRAPAGRMTDGVLTLRLVARVARWHPDRDTDPGVVTWAFAEEGGPPQVPGPLVRVPAGTEVRATVRNALPGVPLLLHGMMTRPLPPGVVGDSVPLAPGETRELRFRLDEAGTFLYAASVVDRPRTQRDLEGTLAGAIVVDSAGAGPPRDRVLVVSIWDEPPDPRGTAARRDALAINGRSWPHTERLRAAVGDTVRWRVVNTSGRVHPMHLHGFYFRVERRGDGMRDAAVAREGGDLVVTETVRPRSTFTMAWTPEREGNWLFHCHLPFHMLPHLPLGPTRLAVRDSTALVAARSGVHHANHARDGMGGLVVGVEVGAARGGAPGRAIGTTARAPRRLRLVARPHAGGTAERPAFGYTLLRPGEPEPPPDSGTRAGPTIVLARGEPVSITVVNGLAEPTSVHWHGIELESYFDGVAGFSGSAARLAPVIAPRDSFEARFTPPRAGTFIYHTHVDEPRQMRAGLTGALLVVEPGARHDPATDRVVLVTSQWGGRGAGVLLNGFAAPPPMELRAGARHRLRLVNITVGNPALVLSLVASDSTPVEWRPLAKDGADLPRDRRLPLRARQTVSIGETFDVELVSATRADLRLEARTAAGVLLGAMPVRIR